VDAVLNSSGRTDWQTPDNLLEFVRRVGAIVLDPCTTSSNPCRARRTLVYPYGLTELWTRLAAGGLIYVNPPYGRALPVWVEKVLEEQHRGASIILLTPSRTDTRWFQRAYGSCAAACLWSGRLKFRGATDPAPFPSALFFFGARPKALQFVKVFDPHGITILR
jgi:hypothetical protein